MNYNDFDLIITNAVIKTDILKSHKGLLKPKIITLSDFKNLIIGDIDPNSVYFLMKKYNLNIHETKTYLNNIYFLKNYYDDLIKHGLIKLNNFKFKNILVINEFIDPYLTKKLKEINITYYKHLNSTKKHDVYSFKTLEEELNFIASKISELLKTIDINKIKIVNKSNSYDLMIKKIFDFYKIPINLNRKSSIYKLTDTINFINSLKTSKNIEVSLNLIKNEETKKLIIKVLNKYIYNEIDDELFNIINEDIKKIEVVQDKLLNAIECIELNEVYDNGNYYFLINFNEGEIPKEYKDEDYFSDEDKKNMFVFTSAEKNKFEKELFINIYQSIDNLILSYKENSETDEFLPSYLIQELNMKVIDNAEINYNYSHLSNELLLGKMLDDYILYNEKHPDLEKLYSTYNNIPYMDYDNKFKGLVNKQHKDFVLSFTSINDYYNCGFKYYIKKVLDLEIAKESINLLVGNLFHKVLEKMYDKNFSFENEFNTYLNNLNLTHKELFFANILKEELNYAINMILKMEKHTCLKEVENELKVLVKKNNYKLYGIIDKVLYKNVDGKTLAVVIDYKTGQINSNLDNINHGLNLQLPIYGYLLKESKPNVIVGGIYLQQVLNKLELDETELDKEKRFYLQGYTINELKLLKLIDNFYENSEMIRNLKTTSKGFYHYAKMLDHNQMDKIINIASIKIKEAHEKITKMEFDINPKKINNKNVSCTFCEFKDICFVKEEDYIELKDTKFKEVMENEIY